MADDPTKTGASADEPEGDDLEDALEGDELDEGEDGGEPEWKAPTRQEWEAAQAALEAEKAKLKRARAQAERLRKNGGKTDPPSAGEGGAAAAGAGNAGEIEAWKTRAVRASAKAELLDRGADPDMVDLALARLKTASVEFNEDDEPELDDWLDDMQERYPKLFAKAAPAPAASAPRPRGVDQGAATGGRALRPKPSLGQQIIEKSELHARRRRM